LSNALNDHDRHEQENRKRLRQDDFDNDPNPIES
jgi:hypothetical protein